jgi:4-hydroxy 2-oxovalerate aldolase
MIKDAADKGYEVSANLMAVSRASELEIEQALELLAETPVSAIVVVDSFGSLYAEQIEILVKKYLKYAQAAGKQEARAKLDFFICSDQWCVKQVKDVTIPVDVR